MKSFVLPSAALVVTASLFAIGCSSATSGSGNGGSSSSVSSALGTFRSPTGSFNASNGSSTLASMLQQQQQGAAVGGNGGAGAGGIATRALRKLDLGGDETSPSSEGSCAEGAQCACDAGGTFSYKQESANEGKALRITFNDCVDTDGSGFDGEALFLVSQRALLEDKRLPAYGSGQSLLLVAKGTLTEKRSSQEVAVALLSQPNVKLVAVQVDDGAVVLGQTSTGTIIVRAKDTAWTCNPKSAGTYVCKEDNTGESVTISESGESASPPPAPSGSNGGSNGSGPATPPPPSNG